MRSRKPSVAAKRDEREDGKMETAEGAEDGGAEPSTSSDGVAVMKEKEEEGALRRGEKREREEEEEDSNQPSAKRPKPDPKEPGMLL